jgi:hypothetical protein
MNLSHWTPLERGRICLSMVANQCPTMCSKHYHVCPLRFSDVGLPPPAHDARCLRFIPVGVQNRTFGRIHFWPRPPPPVVVASDSLKLIYTCGTLGYWAVTLAIVPVTFGVSTVVARDLVRRYHVKTRAGYAYKEGEVFVYLGSVRLCKEGELSVYSAPGIVMINVGCFVLGVFGFWVEVLGSRAAVPRPPRFSICLHRFGPAGLE